VTGVPAKGSSHERVKNRERYSSAPFSLVARRSRIWPSPAKADRQQEQTRFRKAAIPATLITGDVSRI